MNRVFHIVDEISKDVNAYKVMTTKVDFHCESEADAKKIQENIYAATYQDGTVVYVNYGEKDTDVSGITVPAMGFYRKGGN